MDLNNSTQTKRHVLMSEVKMQLRLLSSSFKHILGPGMLGGMDQIKLIHGVGNWT